jgi:tRNA (adenine37-N6)-methyltransferase
MLLTATLSSLGLRPAVCWRAAINARRYFAVVSDEKFQIEPIGFIESPYDRKFGVPKQATISNVEQPAREGRIRLLPEFREALEELEGFDYIWAITYMHLNRGYKLKVNPKPVQGAVAQPPHAVGLFCTRAPHRPNPLALSALRVTHVDVKAGTVDVVGIDLLDGTPVVDIKPYIPAFDSFPGAAAGWMDTVRGSSPEEVAHARTHGYQSISSARGVRAERARLRALKELGEDIQQFWKNREALD